MPVFDVRFSGQAFEVGRKHGRSSQDAVRFNVANFWKGCSAAGLDRSAIFEAARRVAQDYCGQILEEIQGIAAGADVKWE
jgi:hypothetical protein